MSLIYSKMITSDQGFIISDTMFTYREPITNKEKLYSEAECYIGGLKSILLHSGLVVAFAGEVLFAKMAIENIYSNPNVDLSNIDSILRYFWKFNNESIINGSETDFLIVANISDGIKTFIVAHRRADIVSDITNWIGDEDGFRSLQGHLRGFHPPLIEYKHSQISILAISEEKAIPSELQVELNNYIQAFREVCNSSRCPSVSGNTTAIVLRPNGFFYCEHLMVSGMATPSNVIDLNGSRPLHFGDTSIGSFFVHSGREVSLPVYPVEYQNGEMGIIYSPAVSFTPKVVSAPFEDFQRVYQQNIQEVSNLFFGRYSS